MIYNRKYQSKWQDSKSMDKTRQGTPKEDEHEAKKSSCVGTEFYDRTTAENDR